MLTKKQKEIKKDIISRHATAIVVLIILGSLLFVSAMKNRKLGLELDAQAMPQKQNSDSSLNSFPMVDIIGIHVDAVTTELVIFMSVVSSDVKYITHVTLPIDRIVKEE